MKKGLLLVALVGSLLSAPIFAHPGRTASDGCHYCRTNCADWGEIEGARHCHNSYNKSELKVLCLAGDLLACQDGPSDKKPKQGPHLEKE